MSVRSNVSVRVPTLSPVSVKLPEPSVVVALSVPDTRTVTPPRPRPPRRARSDDALLPSMTVPWRVAAAGDVGDRSEPPQETTPTTHRTRATRIADAGWRPALS